MKNLLFVGLLILATMLAACGPPDQASGGGEGNGGDSGGEAEQAAADTPTAVVLATPTPRPAPDTPTPRPTAAPLESAPADEEGEEGDAAAEADEGAGDAEAESEAAAESEAPAPMAEEMVEIPAGTYTIGQDGSKPKNGPAHEVELAAYEIDRFEVTNDEFARFVEETGYTTYAESQGSKSWQDAAADKGNHPVVYVTWDDAVAYCDWAGKRLPTEEEWEVAARGEDGRLYPWGDEFPGDEAVAEFGNLYETGLRSTFPVGAFEQGVSPFGLYDVAGNVREWTSSAFLPYPGAAADADPFFGEDKRVHRGGGWFDGQDGEVVTTYNRNAGPPETSANDDIGFRCARDGS